jgi:enoyl-CoA hydratase/carnithine racemase
VGLELAWRGDVALLTWDDGENRINADTLAAWHARLDEVEAREGPRALVATGAGKFFSNGLDLERFGSDPEEFAAAIQGLLRLVARLYVFPAYTVAAINGHAFAGGALLSCAFDRRVMRADRGYWCMNEVDIGLPLTPELAAIVFARLPRAAAIEAILTGRRYGAADAVAEGIVEEQADAAEVVERAVALAAAMAPKDRSVVRAHKRLAHRELIAAIGYPES